MSDPIDEEPARELLRAKQSVRAALADAGGMTPPSVRSRTPIKALPPDLAAAVQARAQRGLDPLGTDSPGGSVISRVVLPSAVLAVLDAILLILALTSGSTALAVVAGVLLVLFTAVALAGRRAAAADQSRLTARDRIAVADAGRWSSGQQWSGALASTPECALVVAAARAAARIVASPAWTSGALARDGVTLAVGAELDQLDATAFALASWRRGQDTATAHELDDAWEMTLTRVAALTAYADTLDAPLTAPVPAGQQHGPALGPAQRDALAFFLSPVIYDVG